MKTRTAMSCHDTVGAERERPKCDRNCSLGDLIGDTASLRSFCFDFIMKPCDANLLQPSKQSRMGNVFVHFVMCAGE